MNDKINMVDIEREAEEPSAWRVYCPVRHEFDYKVFCDKMEAEIECDEFNTDLSEDDPNKFTVDDLYAVDLPALIAYIRKLEMREKET